MFDITRNNPAFYHHLRPENTIVLFIDLQSGIVSGVKTIDPVVLRNNIAALAKITLLYDLPAILTTSGCNGPNGPIMRELTALFPDKEVIDRAHINAWEDPRIVDIIRRSGRKKLVICGVSTDVTVTFAAISAVSAGYDAYAVMDASGTWSHLIETGALLRMAQAGVIPTNWSAVTAELQSDWTRTTGDEVARIFEESLGHYGFATQSYLASGGQAPPPAESRR